MPLPERLAGLGCTIERCTLERRALPVRRGFERVTTIVRLAGGGLAGAGEDVAWDVADHDALAVHGAALPVAGRFTLASFSEHLDRIELFSEPPRHESARSYRRWAFESAALDLALLQAGLGLPEVLGREARPVRFVASPGLGSPPTADPVHRLREACPGLRFKLDAGPAWTPALIRELADTGAVDVVDFKGAYRGTIVDTPADPVLYARVIEAFPEAWIEDPGWTPETAPILAPHVGRIAWDAPIHGVADLARLPAPVRVLNVKPSRSGRLAELLELYEHAERAGIPCYGGGQFELGPGRAQIQLLAAVFHPDAANDVAPIAYHAPAAGGSLPAPPLPPAPARAGFRRAGEETP